MSIANSGGDPVSMRPSHIVRHREHHRLSLCRFLILDMRPSLGIRHKSTCDYRSFPWQPETQRIDFIRIVRFVAEFLAVFNVYCCIRGNLARRRLRKRLEGSLLRNLRMVPVLSKFVHDDSESLIEKVWSVGGLALKRRCAVSNGRPSSFFLYRPDRKDKDGQLQ